MTNGEVGFTVKELIQRIETKLDLIDSKLDSKADVSAVDSLQGRLGTIELLGSPGAQNAIKAVQQIEGRVRTLETDKAERSAVTQYRMWLIGVAMFASLNLVWNVIAFFVHR